MLNLYQSIIYSLFNINQSNDTSCSSGVDIVTVNEPGSSAFAGIFSLMDNVLAVWVEGVRNTNDVAFMDVDRMTIVDVPAGRTPLPAEVANCFCVLSLMIRFSADNDFALTASLNVALPDASMVATVFPRES